MSRKHLTALDMGGNQIIDANLQNAVANTPAAGDNTTKVATTAFVQTLANNLGAGDMLVSDYGGSAAGVVAQADVALSVDYGNISNLPATFPAAPHNHVAADITDIEATIDSRVNALVGVASGGNTALDDLTEWYASIQASGDAVSAAIRRYAQDVGDGTQTSIAVAHNLGDLDVAVEVYENASGATVICDVIRTNANTVTLGFASAPAAAAFRVVVKF